MLREKPSGYIDSFHKNSTSSFVGALKDDNSSTHREEEIFILPDGSESEE